MKNLKTFLVIIPLLFLFVNVGWGQIAAWDFTGVGTTSLPTYAATTFNSNLVSTSGANNVSRGSTAAWSTGGNSFRTVGFKNEGIATSNTDYFQITLTAATGYIISLSTIDARLGGTASFCATPGVTSQFAYSLDGSTFTLIGSPQVVIGSPQSLTQINLSSISALQNVAAGTTITIRYYASGQTTTGGWGFLSAATPGTNGLAIGGSVLAVAPTGQANTITTTPNGANGLNVSWINGNGTSRLVIINTVNSFTNPTNGTEPTGNLTYSGSGEQVVYSGNAKGSPIIVTGLTTNGTYWFRVFEYNGSGTSTNYLTSTDAGNPNQGTNPVTLASLNSNITGRNVKINWTTAEELNNSGFEIERAEVGTKNTDYNKVTFVAGNGTKNTPTNYSYEDKNLNTGKYKYRLKQIDFNGNFEYFNLNGEIEIGVPKKYDLSQNYPNPFNPTTKINFDLPQDSKVELRIYDMLGREVTTLVNEVRTAGYYTVELNASQFTSGTYFYRLNAGDFSMVKKLVILK